MAQKQTVNKKVKNATPCEMDGIQFKSKLELFCYRKLKENGIEAKYEEERFTLLEKFEYNGENVRAMTFKPDFVGDGFVIECKGNMNDAFPLRWKLFKNYLLRTFGKEGPKIYMPRNQKQVLKAIEEIKNEQGRGS